MTDTMVAAPAIGGFVPADEEWVWVECDGEAPWQRLKAKDGAEPLRAEVLVSLTNAQVAKIPTEDGTPYSALWPFLVRTVRAWNVKALDLATGEYLPVPPPTEGGIESLQNVHGMITEWLAFVVKFARLRDRALPKESASSGGMPNPQPAPNLDSSNPAKRSRKSQKTLT